MTQEKLWKQMIQPGITAIVGAGGKTTVLTKLAEYSCAWRQPVVVSTTTKLLLSQVERWNPYFGTEFAEAEAHCSKAVINDTCGAWFRGVNEEQKVTSVEPAWLDHLHMVHPNWTILVEADGARAKWLKAPKSTEPVIPKHTAQTIGVVNFHILGEVLDTTLVHNIDLVSDIMNCSIGEKVTPKMLMKLVRHQNGIFQYSQGKRILFCTGYDQVDHQLVNAFLDEMAATMEHTKLPLAFIVLADGYKDTCTINKIINWRTQEK